MSLAFMDFNPYLSFGRLDMSLAFTDFNPYLPFGRDTLR